MIEKHGAAPSRGVNGTRRPAFPDWHAVAHTVLLARELDRIEEQELAPTGAVTYQFSSRGHELGQAILGQLITHPHDGAGVYYRTRPFMLTQGLTPEESFAASLARDGSPSRGRDIGVVHSMPSRGKATVLPTSGDVGAQYSPAAGWAQAIIYRAEVLKDAEWRGAIALTHGGDGSTATNGFWAALTIATTQHLPMLFYIEDNGYAISVPHEYQTAGGNIARNLQSFKNLLVIDGEGTNPESCPARIEQAVHHVREGRGPCLLRLTVPRLAGHSFSDNAAYKSAEVRAEEEHRDPLVRLQKYLVPRVMTQEEWNAIAAQAVKEASAARDAALAHAEPDPAGAARNLFFSGEAQKAGGLLPEGAMPSPEPHGESAVARVNLIDAVRMTLDHELAVNPRVVVFGEDVGVKGGVHGATVDLQVKHGAARVFDTSLNEDGIVGRAVGMAIAGLMPVPEIQFRKYADPATEQINDCGTIRWRTANTFAAPLVLRMPVGFGKRTGDPWHSVTSEAVYAHTLGWRIAFPSNAADAVGLLRAALRGNDPTLFFEHRALLDVSASRRPYPGHDHVLEFGRAAVVREGSRATVVSWGAMLHRCVEAANGIDGVEIIDLRTIAPWDRDTVLASVRKTGRCVIVHEDFGTNGFGAEIAATITQEAFTALDAPVKRLTTNDCPIPYNPGLMGAVVPGVDDIRRTIESILTF